MTMCDARTAAIVPDQFCVQDQKASRKTSKGRKPKDVKVSIAEASVNTQVYAIFQTS